MIKGYLFDMDGVLYRGEDPIPEALCFLRKIQAAGKPYRMITNDGCRVPEEYSAKLGRMGVTVPPDRIYTCAQASAEWLVQQCAERVFVIGEPGLVTTLNTYGIAVADCDVSHVLVALDRYATYDKLAHASRLVQRGAKIVATSMDAYYPVEGYLAPGCGALVAMLELATGTKAVPIGKPEPLMFERAAQKLQLQASELMMIGDTLIADIAGANKAGIYSVLVLTGNTSLENLEASSIRPKQVIRSLTELENFL
jgi:HAD superfamily hydrolase (TIGR01457 family)